MRLPKIAWRANGLRVMILLGALVLVLVLILDLSSSGNRIIVAKSMSVVNFKHFNTQRHRKEPSSETKFVYFVGIEGTGHHLIRDIVSKSPTAKRLDALGLADTHYNLARTNKQLKLQMPLPESLPNNTCASIYTNSTYPLFLELLTSIANKTRNQTVTIPVNCVDRGTFASYPFGPRRHSCFKNPDIDLFYQACNEVGVACEHVYLYRDLYSVIASTTMKRRFNSSVLNAILLYTYILKYLYTALSNHSSKLTACLGVLEPDASNDTVWHPLADLLGWQYQYTEFNVFLNSLYQPPVQMSLQDRKRLIPTELMDEMDALVQAEEKVLSLCPKRSNVVEDV